MGGVVTRTTYTFYIQPRHSCLSPSFLRLLHSTQALGYNIGYFAVSTYPSALTYIWLNTDWQINVHVFNTCWSSDTPLEPLSLIRWFWGWWLCEEMSHEKHAHHQCLAFGSWEKVWPVVFCDQVICVLLSSMVREEARSLKHTRRTHPQNQECGECWETKWWRWRTESTRLNGNLKVRRCVHVTLLICCLFWVLFWWNI